MGDYASIRTKVKQQRNRMYANGGRIAKRAGTVINVIVPGGKSADAAPPPPPMPPMGPPPGGPPMGPPPPPPGAGPGGGPGVPPIAGNAALGAMGAPPMFATGGRVKAMKMPKAKAPPPMSGSSGGFSNSKKAVGQMAPMAGAFKTGGAVKMTGGAGSGVGRLEQYRRK